MHRAQQVKFCPAWGRPYCENVTLQLADSLLQPSISCRGTCLEPMLTFEPSSLEFNPILPIVGNSSQTVKVSNPCSFPIEFYSLQFDQDYKEVRFIYVIYQLQRNNLN